MKKGVLIFGLLFILWSSANGNDLAMDIYQLDDESQNLTIQQVQFSNQFFKVDDLGTLNFGISETNHWLKIIPKDVVFGATYKLILSTITPDTIEIYTFEEGLLKKELIGEGVPSAERFLNYYFKPSIPQRILYLKITGNGQPIALPLRIVRSDIGYDVGITSVLFSGLLYGLVFFIFISNLTLYVNTLERLYLYFCIFNIFCMGVVLYFDGFVKYLFIPDSIYWNNQFIAIAMCGSFVSVNYYIQDFFKIKENVPSLTKYFKGINFFFLAILILSFWHPIGFVLYIKLNLLATSAEAILLFVSVLMLRRNKKEYFTMQLASILLFVLLGTTLQLFFLGFLPVNLITRYSIHCMILPQIFIQTFALGMRFSVLTKEYLQLQTTLRRSSQQYSQSLIRTLENERKRLSSEFHDSIGQNLLVIRNQILLMLRQNYTPNQQQKLKDLASITSETLDEIRSISQNLRPSTLDTLGLSASLHSMIERLKRSTEIQIDLVFEQNIDNIIANNLEINIYRILQELMNNVLKHSKAQTATVTIGRNAEYITIQIRDDGVGFDTEKIALTNTGNGFLSIHERIKILKGDMNIISSANKGVIFNIKIPVNHEP